METRIRESQPLVEVAGGGQNVKLRTLMDWKSKV